MLRATQNPRPQSQNGRENRQRQLRPSGPSTASSSSRVDGTVEGNERSENLDETDPATKEFEKKTSWKLERYLQQLRNAQPGAASAVLDKIAVEIQKESEAWKNVALALWESPYPKGPISTSILEPIWRQTMSEKRVKADELSRIRWINRIQTSWTLPIIEYYGWNDWNCRELRELHKVVALYPEWNKAVDRINAVMLARHESVSIGEYHSRQWPAIGAPARTRSSDSGSPPEKSPFLAEEAKKIVHWSENDRVVIGSHLLTSIDLEITRMEEWALGIPKRVFDRNIGAKGLSKDRYGMLVPAQRSKRPNEIPKLKQRTQLRRQRSPEAPRSENKRARNESGRGTTVAEALALRSSASGSQSTLLPQDAGPEENLPPSPSSATVLDSMASSASTDPDLQRFAVCPFCVENCTAGLVPASFTDSIARKKLFKHMHDIEKTLQGDNSEYVHEIKQSWKDHLRCGSVFYDPPSLGTSTCSSQEAEFWHLDQATFKKYAETGMSFDKPVIIQEMFQDSGRYQLDLFVKNAKHWLENTIELQEHQTGSLKRISSCDLNDYLETPSIIYNRLFADPWADADKPGLTKIERFRLLSLIISRIKTRSIKKDMEGPEESALHDLTELSIINIGKTFTGARVNALGGSWVRPLWGKKAWTVVPSSEMDHANWEDFGRLGYRWQPKHKGRTVFLEPGMVLLMPRLAVSQVFSEETGGMKIGTFWDERMISSSVDDLIQATQLPKAMVGLSREHVQCLVSELRHFVESEPDLFSNAGQAGFKVLQERLDRLLMALGRKEK